MHLNGTCIQKQLKVSSNVVLQQKLHLVKVCRVTLIVHHPVHLKGIRIHNNKKKKKSSSVFISLSK